MGQVFTWEAVRQGHIPQLDSFTEVVDTLRKEIAGEPSIIGALVCGSVIRGDHTIRSDIDCFVVYDHEQEYEAFRYMQQATSRAAQLHVPLGFIPCDMLLAGTRMHHVGISFRRHLEKSIDAGGLLKGDPLKYFTHSLLVEDELESYLRVKMYNLQEAWGQIDTFSEERVVAYLRKLLEAPLHVARKTLAHREPLPVDSKVYIRQHYRLTMPEEMATQLDFLIDMDAWYSHELVSAIRTLDEESYRSTIEHLRTASGRVLAFVRSNLAFIATTPR